MSRRIARWLFALLVLVVFPACAWYPYDWRPLRVPNHAARSAGGALLLLEPGIAHSQGAPAGLLALRRAERFRVALRLRPLRHEQSGPARIFAFSRSSSEQNLSLAQQGSALHLRWRAEGTAREACPELVVPGAFRAGEWVTLLVTVAQGFVRVELDGREVGRASTPQAITSRWNAAYPVALGNDLGGDRPWLGEIARASIEIDEQRVDLLAPGQLTLPAMVRWCNNPPKLAPLSGLQLRDGMVNLLGFVPLGFALNFAPARRQRLALAALVGFATSLVLEIVQVWLPTRFPSIDDLVLNTLGTVLGFSLGRTTLTEVIRRVKPKRW